jgi:putative acetyltransferase
MEAPPDSRRRPTGPPLPEVSVPAGVKVRPARPRDARQVLTLVRSVAAEGRFIRTEDVPWTLRELRRQFRRSWTSASARIVAVACGVVVGDLGIKREEHAVLRHVAELGMSVAREWRGRGVGSVLLAEAFRWASWADVEKVALTVYPHNEAALALYRKFGFEEEGRLVGQSKKSYGYDDEIVMGRWLP